MADLSETIEQTADEPAEATGDAGSARAQPLPDLIAADKYLKGNAAVAGTGNQGGPRSGWGGVRAGRAIPPGAV